MVGFAFDENFNNDVLRALIRRKPSLDFVRIQDTPLRGCDDEAVLDWTASVSRVLVTHDVTTLTGFAYDRLRQGQHMPGLIAVGCDLSIATAIEDLLLISECGEPEDFEGKVIYLPLD